MTLERKDGGVDGGAFRCFLSSRPWMDDTVDGLAFMIIIWLVFANQLTYIYWRIRAHAIACLIVYYICDERV